MNSSEFRRKLFSISKDLYPMVARMIGDHDRTEDAIQEIMLKLWEKRNQIAKHPNMKGLVFLTARNYCIDLLRKKKMEVGSDSLKFEVFKSEDSLKQLEYEELNTVIRKIINDLPDQQKEVLMMRDLDGYEFTEIAAAMELKIEHVRVLLSRARKHVSLKLETIYGYERGRDSKIVR